MDNRLTKAELAAMFADPAWAAKYPPVMNVDQAVELLQTHKDTFYGWSSQGKLEGSKTRAGKRLLIFRDRLLQLLAEGKLHG